MSDPATTIAENLAHLRQRVSAAAQRSGRTANDIKLVAVSKYVDIPTTKLLINAGCTDLGESRPQQLWQKAEAINDANVRWHLVGHLQRNKIRRTLPHASLIQSVDSIAALAAVDRIAGELGVMADVLLEVNVSGDDAKHGLAADEVAPLLDGAMKLPHVSISGLMTMAALAGGDDTARKNFSDLRKLRDQLVSRCDGSYSLTELSMGMSNDFEIAVEEGATIVRIGSALFDGLRN